jgi:hypothetical protein
MPIPPCAGIHTYLGVSKQATLVVPGLHVMAAWRAMLGWLEIKTQQKGVPTVLLAPYEAGVQQLCQCTHKLSTQRAPAQDLLGKICRNRHAAPNLRALHKSCVADLSSISQAFDIDGSICNDTASSHMHGRSQDPTGTRMLLGVQCNTNPSCRHTKQYSCAPVLQRISTRHLHYQPKINRRVSATCSGAPHHHPQLCRIRPLATHHPAHVHLLMGNHTARQHRKICAGC